MYNNKKWVLIAVMVTILLSCKKLEVTKPVEKIKIINVVVRINYTSGNIDSTNHVTLINN